MDRSMSNMKGGQSSSLVKLNQKKSNKELSEFSELHDLAILLDSHWNCVKIVKHSEFNPLRLIKINQPFFYLNPAERNKIELLLIENKAGAVLKEITVFLGNKPFLINLTISFSASVKNGFIINADFPFEEENLNPFNEHNISQQNSTPNNYFPEEIERKYIALLDALDEGIVMINRHGEYFARNNSAMKIFGEDVHKIRDNSPDITFYDETGRDLKFVDLPLLHTLRTGESQTNVKIRINRNGKQPLWLSINSHPIYFSGNKSKDPDAAVATYTDITAEREKDEALIAQTEKILSYSARISNILNSISDGLIALDKEMRVVLWNKAIEHSTGISFEEAVGQSIKDILPQYVDKKEFRRLKKAVKDRRTTITEMYSPHLKIWIETSSHPTEEGMLMYLRNITERKIQQKIMKLENDLLPFAHSENAEISDILEYFFRNISLLAEEDLPGLPVIVNNQKMEIPLIMKGKSAQEINFKLSEFNKKELLQFLSLSASRPVSEYSNLHSCGKIINKLAAENNCDSLIILNIPIAGNQWEVFLLFLYNSAVSAFLHKLPYIKKLGEILGTVISGKLSYKNLIQANELYYLSSLATKDWLYDWRLETNKVYWNQAFFDLLGYERSAETETLEFWFQIIHEKDREMIKKRTLNVLNSFVRSQVVIGEYRIKTKRGEYRNVYDRGYLMFDQKGEVTRMVGAVQDVTDQKLLQEKLTGEKVKHQQLMARAVLEAQETERMEIGKELHDNVNQILSTVRLYLELERTGKKMPFNIIERSSGLINSAISEIRTLSRTLIQPSIKDIGLEHAIKDLIASIEVTGKLKVKFEFDEKVEPMLNQQHKLNIFRIIQEQLNNVIKHANAKKLSILVKKVKNSVSLTVSDNGVGVDINNIKHHSGVGLSNIFSRSELFNGSVKITSSPGEGFTLNVLIPISYN